MGRKRGTYEARQEHDDEEIDRTIQDAKEWIGLELSPIKTKESQQRQVEIYKTNGLLQEYFERRCLSFDHVVSLILNRDRRRDIDWKSELLRDGVLSMESRSGLSYGLYEIPLST